MKFLVQIHRAITDPSYYNDIVALRFRSAFWFFIRILCVFALLAAVVHTSLLTRKGSELSKTLAEIFTGITIQKNTMQLPAVLPYIPPARTIATIIDVINNTNSNGAVVPESLLVFDTTHIPSQSSRFIQFGATAISIHFRGKSNGIEFPYKQVLDSTGNGDFSQTSIEHFFGRLWPSLFVGALIQNVIVLFSAAIAALFFLFGIAIFSGAYFKIGFKAFMKISCFALTPSLIGCMLMLVSGTRATLPFSGNAVPWLFYIFVGISAFSMLRGLRYVVTSAHHGTH